MSKNTKRWLGIVIATVLIVALGIAGFAMASAPEEEPECYLHGDVNGDGIVNKDDAIYLLYASFPGLAEEFPLQHDGKINDDDVINKDDAIYLLYASFENLRDEFPLKGEIHSYYDPTWTWDEAAGTAKVTFKCGCGGEHTENAVVAADQLSDPTCVAAGSTKLTATVNYEGTAYTDTKTIVIPATGEHALNEASCTEDLECANCDYAVAAPGHSYALINTTPATCTAQTVEHYKCSVCQDTKDVTLEGNVGHTLTYLEGQDRATGNDCEFIKQYKCSVCFGVFDGTAAADTYIKHTYVTTLTNEVTCVQDGLKTTACSQCGDVKETETLPKDTSKHVWDNGTVSEGKITFACKQTGCTETKVEVVASQDGAVDTSNLDANTGVNLGDTSVVLDQGALESLTSTNIIIKVEEKDKTTVGLSAEQANQIPTNTVYDFTMTYDDNTPVTNFGAGLVTVTLPYELEPGEDINSIDIWYIDGDGNPARVEGAVYSNGFVTFQTNHFSYYTVTRLTAVERCERLGSHIEIQQTKAATCTEDGYDMTVCQRCGEVISKTIHEKTGHSYTDSVQAATCTVEGKLTQTCTNGSCGHVLTKILPALGHDMKTDSDKSVAATCDEAGKTVKVCGRGCGYTTEEPIAQLTHDYKKSDEKSVAATCSAAGYDVYVCSLCDSEVRKNDIAPLGHNFPEEKVIWNWTSDTTAVATLVCANDASHTKVLDAVVTKNEDKSQNTSCLGSGSTVYEAAAGYNNKTYISINEITVDAPGHKPGTVLESSAGQHYYLCTVCNEKLEAEAHAWNEGAVTKQPTCVASGSKTVECTVCHYTKDQVIPATGDHSYANGVCTVCGFQQGGCRHLPIHKTQVDTDALGICEGAVVYKYSCDCGQTAEYELQGIGCNFGNFDYEEGKDEYGFSYYRGVAFCADCGMAAVETGRSIVDPEACYRDSFYAEELYMGNTMVYYNERHPYGTSHPGVGEARVEVIEDDSICGPITITYKRCICGEYEVVSRETACQFGWSVDGDEYQGHGYCFECGAELFVENTYETAENDPCVKIVRSTYTFKQGNKVLHTYQEAGESENHSVKLTNCEIMGDSCEDGVFAQAVCEKCGETYEEFIRYHEPLLQERIDISEHNLCSKTLVLTSCPCEMAYSDYYLENVDGEGCELEWVWDKDLQQEYWVCYECGVRRYETVTYGEKDENCFCLTYTEARFVDQEGKTLFTANGRGDVSKHNMKREVKLVEGATTCFDGIIIREYCTDCTYEHSYENNYHETAEVATYDLSAFGSCMESITLYRCPCGMNSYTDSDTYCQMEWVDNNVENQEQYQCRVCGLQEVISYSWPETDDECLNQVVRVYTYSKEGVDATVRFTTEEYNWNHDYIFELVLHEGATSCEDGWSGSGVCRRCGDVETIRNAYWHNTYTISTESVDNGKMCGEVTMEVSSCACGEYGGSYIEWDEENRCEFAQGRYSEELNTWVYTCAKCGSYRYSEWSHIPIEGTTCQYRYENRDCYFDKDGNELFVRESGHTEYMHEYLVSFVNADGSAWEGKDCSEGYYVLRTCTKCGESYQSHEYYNGCNTFNISATQLYDGTDICSPITLYKRSCACGKNTSVEVGNECRWVNYSWDDAKDMERMECMQCGVIHYIREESQMRPGTCYADAKLKRQFYLGDNLIAEVDETYTREEHLWVHTFDNQPESCEQGWSYTFSCFHCGKIGGRSSDNYYHENTATAFYDLGANGMCNGYIAVYNCACGQQSSWEFRNDDCTWNHKGQQEDGANVYYCAECETYCYRYQTGERDENCKFIGSERLLFVRGDETLLDVTIAQSYVSHQTRVVSASLVTPDTSCENGVYTVWACENCDYSHTSTEHYHRTMDIQTIETSCGTQLRAYSCPCGERAGRSYYSNRCDSETKVHEEKGDENSGTYQYHYVCRDCGLDVNEEYTWTKPEGTCEGAREGSYTVVYNGETWGFKLKYTYEQHNWGDTVYTLKPGATTCEGNLIATQTCQTCEHVSTWNPSGHGMNKVETLDLKDFGATCGGDIYVYQCPCGATGRYDISEDALCKLQQQGTELWIEDALHNVSQPGVHGTTWFYSNAWTFTCAVTEPACSLKLRMAEYWKVSGCIAYEYQTWQSWNAETNEWEDIATLATGYREPYHNYTQSNVDKQEGGATVTGKQLACSCGAYYHELTYRYEDGTYKTTTDAKDTTGISDRTETHMVHEYMYTQNNNILATRTYSEQVYKNGETEWFQYVYAYDFDGTCKVTETFTSSHGESWVEEEEHIQRSRQLSTVTDSTCTQPGVGKWESICAICEAAYDPEFVEFNPHNHSWYSNNEGTYTCGRCGQESQNGASDGIVIEDFTEKYGNGTEYVAGYWNRDEVEFINSVCVIIEGQDPIYLEGLTVTERTDIVAISFDMQLAHQLADEVANGAAYELRLNFVTNEVERMEYAITFTNVAQ